MAGQSGTVLSDAELALGLSRHLSAFQMSAERARLDELEFAGTVFDMAFRLRGSTTSPAKRVAAIGLDVGLSPRNLPAVVAALEALGWIKVDRGRNGEAISVAEVIPPHAQIVAAAANVFSISKLTGLHYAALALLRSTSLQPLLTEDALQAAALAASGDADSADEALRLLVSTKLVRRVTAADGREVVFNPNVWTQGDEIANAALRAADARATGEVGALLEELAVNPGLPDTYVTSTEPRWVQFAISQGLVQRSVIQTTEDKEQGFLFTPHLARDPFGGTAGDASGQVRQLVGSMVYATTFAEYKLWSPEAFLRALINRGVAGDASPIGTDYLMLEKAGIVRVVPGSSESRFSLELMQSEIAEEALKFVSTRDGQGGPRPTVQVLRGQQSYTQLETDRARLALATTPDDVEQAKLIAALREQQLHRGMRVD